LAAVPPVVTLPAMHLLLAWLLWAVAIWLTAKFLPGFEVRGFGGAVIVALLFGLLNALVGHFLYLVIGVTTLGLGFVFGFITRWFVTAVVLKMTDAVSNNLTIASFKTALLASGIISLLGAVGEHLVTHGPKF
jgi:putative membrane protein